MANRLVDKDGSLLDAAVDLPIPSTGAVGRRLSLYVVGSIRHNSRECQRLPQRDLPREVQKAGAELPPVVKAQVRGTIKRSEVLETVNSK
jgi:hypothetical protein